MTRSCLDRMSEQQWQDPLCFFVAGHARSGTTALARLLNSSPELACLFYEGNVLYRLWRILMRSNVLNEPHDDLVIDLETTSRHNLLDKVKRDTEAKDICFSEALIAEFVDGFRKRLEIAKSPLRVYSDTAKDFFCLLSLKSGRTAVGDKVPDYMTIPDVLSRTLPQAKIICTVRDPRATIHSTLKFLDKMPHLFAVSNAFAMAHGLFLRNREVSRLAGNGDKVLPVAQRMLRNEPEGVAEEVCRFLGISLAPEMRTYARHMLINGYQQADKAWEREMQQNDIAAVEAVFLELDPARLSDPRVGKEKNPWVEKSQATSPLVDCDTEEIPNRVHGCRRCFSGDSYRDALSATLVVFADFAHRRGRFRRAHRFFREAVELTPGDGVLWFRFGELCFDMKRLEAAEHCYEESLRLMPDKAYFRFLKAKLLYQLGRVKRLEDRQDEAVSYFESSLNVYPDFKLPKAMLCNGFA